jgi:hypothetical protein
VFVDEGALEATCVAVDVAAVEPLVAGLALAATLEVVAAPASLPVVLVPPVCAIAAAETTSGSTSAK